MSAIIFDTETTGIDAPEVIEAAWLTMDDSLDQVDEYHERFKPSKPISLGAMAMHHIMEEDLQDCRPSSSFALPAGLQYLVGHNVDFDWKVVGEPPVKRICTLALSRSLWPEADSHTLSAMLYLLERKVAREMLRSAHSAAADVAACHLLLEHIVSKLGNVSTFEQLWQASEKARVPTVMAFGKHKGMRVADLPRDYRDWLLRQPDIDPYLRQALRA